MFLATVFFAGRQWLPWAILSIALVAGLLLWAYRKGNVDRGIRTACFSLKLLGIAALIACILEPLWSGQRAKPGSNLFALVADNSQGMRIKDRDALASRGELLRKVLTDNQAEWQTSLEANFQLRRYLFDSRLLATRDYSELLFDGRASAIGHALQGVSERFHGQPLAGVLLFTDGNATDIAETLPNFTGLAPIYPVVSGTDQPIKDIAINKVTTTQTVFEGAPVSIQADILVVGYPGQRIVAELVDAEVTTNRVARTNTPAAKTTTTASATGPPFPAGKGKILATQSVLANATSELLTFRFNIRPERPGLSFVRLRVYSRDEAQDLADSGKTEEATLANNARVIEVDRGKGPYHVLYVSGRPNWEFKFLNRAIDDDDQVRLVALIRVAKREPKFDFRGRQGESSNPLFRGFGNQSKEEIERYDQPVLVRLNTRDKEELRAGFPKLAEDLYGYHAIIVDDLESEFFTPDQMALVQKFVSERGGGFLMLGGAESFQQGKYQKTAIGEMLPVYLDRPAEGKPPTEYRLNLSREGWLQPWARLRNNESDEKSRIGEMPPFQVFNQVREVKPGASIIANVTDPSGKSHPATVVQRFGRGRTAAMMIGDLWHWGFQDKEKQKDLGKGWRQLVRWLVSDVPGRLDLQIKPMAGDANQAVQLQVRARDKKFLPMDGANVSFTVKLAASSEESTEAPKEIKLVAEPSLSEPGLYHATYVPRQTGGYRAAATVVDSNGVEAGKVEGGWTSDPASDEFKSLKPNRGLLEAIAKRTGGEVVPLDKLTEFAKKLPSRKAPVMESFTNPLWHTPALFAFALVCLASEWGLRRWKGMP